MIGVVDLRDVAWRTGPYASPYLESLGLAAEEETVRSLEPPEVLLILGLDVLGGLLSRHRVWLKQARAYHIFILDEGEPDDELRELIAAEYQQYCNVIIVDQSGDEPGKRAESFRVRLV